MEVNCKNCDDREFRISRVDKFHLKFKCIKCGKVTDAIFRTPIVSIGGIGIYIN